MSIQVTESKIQRDEMFDWFLCQKKLFFLTSVLPEWFFFPMGSEELPESGLFLSFLAEK